MNAAVVRQTVRSSLRSVTFRAAMAVTLSTSIALAARGRPVTDVMHSLVVVCALAAPVFVFAANLIGREISSGALNLVLLRPISRTSYLISRIAGTILVIASLYAATAALAFLVHFPRPAPAAALVATLISFGNYLTSALFVFAMFALFGSVTTGYYNVGCYFLWCIFVVQGVGAIVLALAAVGVNIPDDMLDVPPVWALVRATFVSASDEFSLIGSVFIWIWSLTAVAVACLCFSRRELPSATD